MLGEAKSEQEPRMFSSLIPAPSPSLPPSLHSGLSGLSSHACPSPGTGASTCSLSPWGLT